MPLAGLSNDLIHVPLTDANLESLTLDTVGHRQWNFFLCIAHICYLKSLRGTLNWLRSSLNLKLMPHILPTSANETIREETGDYYPVFFSAFVHLDSQCKTLTGHRLEERICSLRA